MDLLRNALAELSVAKGKLYDLVEPEKVIAEKVEGVIHALAQEFEKLYARIVALEHAAAAKIEGTTTEPLAP